ncbi:MAG: hypothetical protein HKN80_12940 [Acidimicrobiia bacterium]|nr:hypothetical protein [Acidimicrobiia bacterium]
MGTIPTVLILLTSLFWAQSAPRTVIFQSTELPYVIDHVSTHAEFKTGESFSIVITVQDGFDAESDDVLRPDPVEFRQSEGLALPLRPIFRRFGAKSFEAEVTFEQQGEWQMVLYPDVANRAGLPGVVPTEMLFIVTSPPAGWLGPLVIAIMAVGLFAFALGGRKRKGPPKRKLPPVTGGDTWWSGG